MLILIWKNLILVTLTVFLFDNALGDALSSASASSSSSEASSYTHTLSNSYTIPRKQIECPVACGAVYNPVCATNGRCYKTFENTCSVDTENCNSLEKFVIVSYGECEKQLLYRPMCDCRVICTVRHAPVCGSNGKCYSTFDNACSLKGYNKCYPYDYFFEIHKGECLDMENPKCS